MNLPSFKVEYLSFVVKIPNCTILGGKHNEVIFQEYFKPIL